MPRIGPIELPEFPLLLAPMAGVSEAPFRQICRRMGADVVLSEFLSSEAIRRRIRNTLEGAEFEEVERPIGIQIYGADANAMAEAAALITRLATDGSPMVFMPIPLLPAEMNIWTP